MKLHSAIGVRRNLGWGVQSVVCDRGAEGAKRPSARPKAVRGVGAGGGRPLPPRGSGGITPGKFLKIQMLAGEF